MNHEEWHAIKNNDKNYDGQFFYALKTTRTVCRPSCTARTCNPQNVIIFYNLEEAIQHGFRPCYRCRPEQMDWNGAKAELAKSAKKWIEDNYTKKFSLEQIASSLYVNKSYLLRVFKTITGYTLLGYHNYVRCEIAKNLFTQQELTISQISTRVGFTTSSHFTKVFKKIYGCTPSAFRKQHLDTFHKSHMSSQ